MRNKKYYRPIGGVVREKPDEKKSDFQLKDFVMPLISALLAVVLNQLFFVPNKKVEANIEFNKEDLRQQMPVINRILSFTYKYEMQTNMFRTYQVYQYLDEDGKLLKEVGDPSDIDSVYITTPAFVTDEKCRKIFEDDIQVLSKQKDLLDHRIYVCLDKLMMFLDKNRLPIIDNNAELMTTQWKEKTVQNEWFALIDALRKSCYDRINEI